MATKPAPGAALNPAPAAKQGTVLAPIPGLIVLIAVQVGESVIAGQTVAVMEAMKMENNLVAQQSGRVLEILVQKGAEVATGDVIMHIG
jgi:biotin carboxyl carrier protein